MIDLLVDDNTLFDESEIWMYAKNIDMDLVRKINKRFKETMAKINLEKDAKRYMHCCVYYGSIWNGNEETVRIVICYDIDDRAFTVSLKNKGDNEMFRKIDKICIADQFSKGVEPDGPYGIDTWRRYITLLKKI